MDGTMDLTAKTELELRAMERAIAKASISINSPIFPSLGALVI